MHMRTYRIRIEAAYKRSALRVISAFRTVSADATVVIAGMLPLGLVVDLERKKSNTRQGADLLNPVQLVDETMEKWQQDWTNSCKGRWTYRARLDELLPDTVVNGPWIS